MIRGVVLWPRDWCGGGFKMNEVLVKVSAAEPPCATWD